MPADKREQVFVSSTYLDLVAERQEVIQTLLEADCIPAGMEMFPASDDDRWTLIKRVIDDCDYYIVVVGGRYGSVDPDRGLSYTEMEFDYAVATKKPVMGFLHGSPGSIAADKTELNAESREKLEAFRAKVGERMVKYWASPQELGGQVAKSLIQIRKTHPAEGWVRARNALTPEVERELAELRARVAELHSELAERRAQPLGDEHDFAHGSDQYELAVLLSYWTKEDVAARRTLSQNRQTLSLTYGVAWDSIFAHLAPFMMDEASENELDSELDRLAFELVVEHADEDLPEDFGKEESILAASHVVQDVKVQLFALGLIERSDRRRAVSDKSTYWRLTARGQDQLMRLRAMRRPAPPDGIPGSGGPEDNSQLEQPPV